MEVHNSVRAKRYEIFNMRTGVANGEVSDGGGHERPIPQRAPPAAIRSTEQLAGIIFAL